MCKHFATNDQHSATFRKHLATDDKLLCDKWQTPYMACKSLKWGGDRLQTLNVGMVSPKCL